MYTFLPGLRAVGIVHSEKILKESVLYAAAGMTVPVTADVQWLQLIGTENTAERTEKTADGSRMQTAKLSFTVDEQLPQDTGSLAFVIRDQQGRTWLVGSHEPPRPVIAETLSFGAPGTSAAGWRYEVTHTHVRTLCPCTVTSI